ncbi:hypothetical protein PLICRDRAFT_38050 [Plicaturopsis crispa FD-325 SS-3]|nr:hypothetical protein PLICRDRAFT_38050 [Plicaturopsis crispa FD-325 SS-3]
MASFKAELMKIPPVTRFLCASSLAVTLPVMLQLLSPYKVVFIRQLVTRRWEVWRLFTSFFLGSSGINFVFDFVMLYRTSESLETTHFLRRSPDYAYQLLLSAAAILTLSIPLNSAVHTRPLLLCLTYLSSALAPAGAQSSIMGLINVPVVYMPYVFVAMDLVMGGPSAAAGAVVGCVVGHVWWWTVFGGGGAAAIGGEFTGLARAPAWMRKLVSAGAGEASAPTTGSGRRSGGGSTGGGVHVIPPRARSEASSNTSGYQWGSGNRLGG